jgi:MFS family permease
LTHSRLEVVTVFGATILLAVVFGTLPALSSVLTDPDEFGLGATLYGLLFVPQALVAIPVALWESTRSGRAGPKPLLLVGLAFDLVAMTLILISPFAIGDEALTYAILLFSSTCMGVGFGLGIPAGISLAAGFFPQRRDRAVLYLNGMVAFGPGIAPLLVAGAVAIGSWSLMPVILLVVFAVTLPVASRLPLSLPASETSASQPTGEPGVSGRSSLPPRFWLYTGFVLLYGIVQTLNGNWATLFMTDDIGATAAQGAFALTVFWVSLGVGRIVFGSLDRVLPERIVFRVLPFVAAVSLLLVALTPDGDVNLALAGFALTGLGCSALLPLAVTFSQTELVSVRSMMSGALVAFYMIGFGIASFGVGPLVEHLGMDPSLMYVAAAAISLVLGALAIIVVRGRDTGVGSRRAHPG